MTMINAMQNSVSAIFSSFSSNELRISVYVTVCRTARLFTTSFRHYAASGGFGASLMLLALKYYLTSEEDENIVSESFSQYRANSLHFGSITRPRRIYINFSYFSLVNVFDQCMGFQNNTNSIVKRHKDKVVRLSCICVDSILFKMMSVYIVGVRNQSRRRAYIYRNHQRIDGYSDDAYMMTTY